MHQLRVQVLMTNAAKYSKGILSEILEFVMGQGLIPADGEVWKVRRRCASAAVRNAARPQVRRTYMRMCCNLPSA